MNAVPLRVTGMRFQGRQAVGQGGVVQGLQEVVALRLGQQGAIVQGQEGGRKQDTHVLGQIACRRALPVDQAQDCALADQIGGGGVGMDQAERGGGCRARGGAAGLQAARRGIGGTARKDLVGLLQDLVGLNRDGAEARGIGTGLAAHQVGGGGYIILPFRAGQISVDQHIVIGEEADQIGGDLQPLQSVQGLGLILGQIGEQAVLRHGFVVFEHQIAGVGLQMQHGIPKAAGKGLRSGDPDVEPVAGHEGIEGGQGPDGHVTHFRFGCAIAKWRVRGKVCDRSRFVIARVCKEGSGRLA